mgnify:FL=1|tara:strand:+ start:342 stop:524 length:183 start_codon:yes stop_codon:yes gene_type:complete
MKRDIEEKALEVYNSFIDKKNPNPKQAYLNSISIINSELNELMRKTTELFEMKNYIKNIK